MPHPIVETPLPELRETYASFRLPSPKMEEAIRSSLQRFGQLAPLQCLESPDGLVVIDGFKRLRAARRLNWQSLRVMILPTTAGGAKASMLVLNRRSQTITDLEEGLIIRSLHREEGLDQREIAVMVGKHPSWVCRRLALIERLHEEVQEHLRLGLISPSVGREIARLPRGNQPALLQVALQHRLGKREVETVVSLLRGLTHAEQHRLLSHPAPLLGRHPAAPAGSRAVFYQRLAALITSQTRVLAGAADLPLPAGERELGLIREAMVLSRKLEEFLAGLGRPESAKEVS